MKSNRLLLFIIVILLSIKNEISNAQKYWQQNVNYKIDVSLDDENHILRASEIMEYQNNSSDTLSYIFIHLWPNAYKNDHTEFSKQQVENGETDFYFSKKIDKGFIDSVSFTVDDLPCNLREYNNMADVAILELPFKLLPGKKINIATPFRVVLPKNVSRGGHDDQSYQITQWYPKPAVYDKDGWHPMPYLNQGEFYSEYGSFDVKITLPKNYVVAATGNLETESEHEFIKSLIDKKNSFQYDKEKKYLLTPETSKEIKTLHFTENNIHDFAWFADKRFLVEKKIIIENKKQINAYSYFLPQNFSLYKNSTDILDKTVSYFSKRIGEYPYKNVSIVDGALLAGGGMEYPTIAIIGKTPNKKTLNTVIIHEVGHNWFYGILGSNERKNPWLDEGINSFYENELVQKLVEDGDVAIEENSNNIVFHINQSENEEQPISSSSEELTAWNYGGIIYAKSALALKYFQSYLGNDLMDDIMQTYFNQWKFKHPNAQDLRKIAEDKSGENLNWFFDELITQNMPIDFKIKKVKKVGNDFYVNIKNKTNFTGPIIVNAVSKNNDVSSIITPQNGISSNIIFENYKDTLKYVELDNSMYQLEKHRTNNKFSLQHFPHNYFHKLKLGASYGIKPYQATFVMPSIGYNYYDKFMLGGIVHNLSLPTSKLQYIFIPMYSFGAKNLVGTGALQYNILPKKSIRKITIGVQGNSFHHNSSDLNVEKDVFLRHIKVAPFAKIYFKQKNLRAKKQDYILAKYYYISNEKYNYKFNAIDNNYKVEKSNTKLINQFFNVSYVHENNRTFNPFSYQGNIEGHNEYIKLSASCNFKFDYFMKNKAFYGRLFAGKFIGFDNGNNFPNRNYFLHTTTTAANDYLYDEVYLGRNENENLFSRQVTSAKEGGFYSRTLLLNQPLGISDNWLTAVNLKSDIPVKLPLNVQLFFNAASFAQASLINPSKNKLLYEGGILLNVMNETFQIQLPLVLSKDFNDYSKQNYPKNRVLNQISFSLNLTPYNFLDSKNILKLIGQ
ncbi:MAG: M1 family metallopeptidase [Chitinophagaceae bacterium]|nr:M1 family metallopeptidase [Chitinophagaceae bacterium]